MSPLLVDKHNGLIDNCFISREQYFSYIHDENKFANKKSCWNVLVTVTVTLKWASLQIMFDSVGLYPAKEKQGPISICSFFFFLTSFMFITWNTMFFTLEISSVSSLFMCC